MSALTAAELATICSATSLSSLVRQHTKLSRSGRNWLGCCPFHGERTPSFYVYNDHYHCFGCGAHGDPIDFVRETQRVSFLEAVRILGGGASKEIVQNLAQFKPGQKDAARGADDVAAAEKRIVRGAGIYAQSGPAGAMVQTYLESRGCGAFIPNALRFHSKCPRPVADNGVEYLPAMVAPITEPASNRLVGAHCTYLQPDGRGKIERGQTKIMWGLWGAIRLSADEDVTTALGICEGIETGISIMQHARWRPIWAAGCHGQIAKFPLLPGIESLTIFPARDDKGHGLRSAEACAVRWRSAGREVRLVCPPVGKDWLDALVKAAA